MSWELVDVPRIDDPRGHLAVVECLPFDIRRVYWLFGVPPESERAGHAHRTLRQALIAVSGSFRVQLDDGHQEAAVWLWRPDQALLLPPGIWREIDRFSGGAVCLVLASAAYSEADYIRDKVSFKEALRDEDPLP